MNNSTIDDTKLLNVHTDKASSTDSSPLCRICYCEESPIREISRIRLPNKRQKLRLLQNPCSCRGSLSFVHEACLIKWLQQKNIRACELCKTPFKVKEEYGSFTEILQQSITFLTKSKKRAVKLLLYLFYLCLFIKRYSMSFEENVTSLKDFLLLLFNLLYKLKNKLIPRTIKTPLSLPTKTPASI